MRQHALKMVSEIAKNNSKIIFIGSDLGAETLSKMKAELPNQYFMEGISEQYLVGFAAGLAKEGFIPYLNTIGTFFTRRAYEQICIDVALHDLPVRFLASGGGTVYAPLGPTHTAIEDFSLMLSIPNLKVFAPADANEMETLILASVTDPNPIYIRFGKGGEKIVTEGYGDSIYDPKIFGNPDAEIVICTTGVVLQHCLDAQKILNTEGLAVTIAHFPYLNDLQVEKSKKMYTKANLIVCAEEHIPIGGLFTRLLHSFQAAGLESKKMKQISLQHKFSHNYGSQLDHLIHNGLDGSSIAKSIKNFLTEQVR